MKRVWLTAVAVAVLVAGPALGQKSAKHGGGSSGVEQQINHLEEQGKEASLKNDASWFEKNLADDFVGVSGTGMVTDKSSAIAMRKSGDLKYEAIDYSDAKVRVYGNTALVSGTAAVKGALKGQDFSGTYHYVRVWVKQGGQWKIAHSQATKAAASS